MHVGLQLMTATLRHHEGTLRDETTLNVYKDEQCEKATIHSQNNLSYIGTHLIITRIIYLHRFLFNLIILFN